jgi:hypothetical protein
VANKAIVVLFLSVVIWWQFWQPIPTAVWMNLPSFFSGWQVKHVSGLMSFGSMKGCSISSSAQTPKGDRRQMTKSVAPPFRVARANLEFLPGQAFFVGPPEGWGFSPAARAAFVECPVLRAGPSCGCGTARPARQEDNWEYLETPGLKPRPSLQWWETQDKTLLPPLRAAGATSVVNRFAEANRGASSVKNLRVPTAQQKCLHC